MRERDQLSQRHRRVGRRRRAHRRLARQQVPRGRLLTRRRARHRVRVPLCQGIVLFTIGSHLKITFDLIKNIFCRLCFILHSKYIFL